VASKKKVIAQKNIGAKSPVLLGIVLWLFLDRLGAPDYVHGIVWTVYAIVFISVLCEWYSSVSVDIFKEEEEEHGST